VSRRLATAAALAAVGATGATIPARPPAGQPARIVARDDTGARVAQLRLPRSGAFALAYRHSYHRRPALERFRAAADGSFRLVAVSSPSAAVLDYYELEGRRSRRGGWWTLRLARPARFESLALAGTALGRRTLASGGLRAPLFRRDGRVLHVRLRVEG
jgi:Domain of unknown function (DUF1850)